MLPTGLSQLAADIEVESGLGDEGDDDWAYDDQELDAADREQKHLQVSTIAAAQQMLQPTVSAAFDALSMALRR